MSPRASKADFLSHGREGVCKEAALGEFVSLEAADETTDVEGELYVMIDGETAVEDVGGVARTDDVLYTSDGFTCSSVILYLSSGKIPDFLNA